MNPGDFSLGLHPDAGELDCYMVGIVQLDGSLLLMLLLLSLLWPCLLLLITLSVVVNNECCSEAHRGCCWVCVVVGWGGVCTVIFMSNPTTVLRLCCVALLLGLRQFSSYKEYFLMNSFELRNSYSNVVFCKPLKMNQQCARIKHLRLLSKMWTSWKKKSWAKYW